MNIHLCHLEQIRGKEKQLLVQITVWIIVEITHYCINYYSNYHCLYKRCN